MSNYSNCSLQYDSVNYKVLAGLRAFAGFISFLCCLLVVVMIVLYKKYKFFSQRLILNVAIAAMIHAISYITSRVNYLTVRKIDDPYCYFAGLFNHYTAAMELISIWFTTINIFSLGMCGKNISRFEALWYMATYCLPLLWFWVPVWLKAYGTSGGWCGFKNFNEDCTKYLPAPYLRFGIWYIPLYTSTFFIIVAMFLVTVKIGRSIHRWKGKYNPVAQSAKEILWKEIRPLIWYPIIYLLLNVFSFASQLQQAINPDSSSVVLTYLRVLTAPFRGAFIALAFSMDRDTRKRLNAAHCRAACLEWKGKREINVLESTTLFTNEEKSGSCDTAYSRYHDNN